MFTTVITVTILCHSSRNRYICSFIHPIPFHSIPIQFHSSDSKASTSNDILVVTLPKILDHFPIFWSKHAMPIILPSEMKLPDTSVLLLPAVVRNLRNPKKVVLWAFFKKLTLDDVACGSGISSCALQVFIHGGHLSHSHFLGLWGYSLVRLWELERWRCVDYIFLRWCTWWTIFVRGLDVWDIVEVILDRWLSVSEILVPPERCRDRMSRLSSYRCCDALENVSPFKVRLFRVFMLNFRGVNQFGNSPSWIQVLFEHIMILSTPLPQSWKASRASPKNTTLSSSTYR